MVVNYVALNSNNKYIVVVWSLKIYKYLLKYNFAYFQYKERSVNNNQNIYTKQT